MVNLVAVQMTSEPDVDTNLRFVEQQLAQLDTHEPTLVVLPECFACFGTRDRSLLEIAEPRYTGKIGQAMQRMAKQYGVYLVTGTFPLHADTDDKFTASCLLVGPDGEIIDEYKKIHLFDVSVKDKTGSYQESAYTQAGDKVVVCDTPIGRIGLAVCYDVRFTGLFNAMGDVDILVLPAAFTRYTGNAHWHTLVRARAIEKQCFVVAPNQTGDHANDRETFGHSVIYSPWGDTLAERPTEPGLVSKVVNISDRDQLKQNMPVAQHNQFRSDFVK